MGNCVSDDSADNTGRGGSSSNGQPAAFYGAGPAYATAEVTNGYPGPPTAPPVVTAQHPAYAQPEYAQPAYAQPAYAQPPPPMPPPMPAAYAQSPPAPSTTSDSSFSEIIQLLEGTQMMVAIDGSGSMTGRVANNVPQSKTDFVIAHLRPFLSALLEIDTDGVDIYFYGTEIRHMLAQSHNLDQVLAHARTPMMTTNTAGVMQAMWEARNPRVAKTLAIIITDGSPDNTQACIQRVIEYSGKVENTVQFNYLFLQVGNDDGAAAFLKRLDDMVLSGDGRHDIVDTARFEDVFASPRALFEVLRGGMID